MIGRTIDAALVENLAGSTPTTCRCLKIIPIAVGVEPFGITDLDRDVPFDGMIYRARRGYTASAQVGSSDLSVENSEAEALLAEFPLDGITPEMVRRGVLDDARFVEYLVNFLDEDTSSKATLGTGTIGELRQDRGMRVFIERRSLTQTLKQKGIIELGSVSCTAAFGDERCKFPVDTLWEAGIVVDSVGFETDLTFSFDVGSLLGTEDGYYVPGLVFWVTGDNAGRTSEIDEYVVDSGTATVTLVHPTDDPIGAGDTFDIRPDCNKWWGPNGTDLAGTRNNCLYFLNRPNFRGQPFRPVADSAAMSVPGAAGSGGASGVGSTQTVTPDMPA